MRASRQVDRSWNFSGSLEKESALKPLCQQIEGQFPVPSRRLCRYFASTDDAYLVTWHGKHFRGFHGPFSARTALPQYLLHSFFHPFEDLSGDETFEETIAFDNLIYIRHCTCADLTGLVTTYAHEFQHFIQYANTPLLWAVNGVLYENLKKFEPTAIATDIPTEREANIVSKRVAELLCGSEAVRAFADEQIRLMESCGEREQKERWIFFRDVPSSANHDLKESTLALVERYKGLMKFDVDVDHPEWWLGKCSPDNDDE
jgi:hypothetical protein